MKQLTIAIPTYNRCALLDRLLFDLCEEIATLDDARQLLVDIWVIDNVSTDRTSEIIKKWTQKSTNIHAEKNSANLGIEGNIIKASLISGSDYTWLLSDHQRIRPGILNDIFDVLDLERPSLIVMGIDQWPSTYSYPEKEARFVHELSPNELGEIFFLIGNLSTNLFEKSLAIATARDAVRISYSYYPNMAKLIGLHSKSVICRITAATTLPANSENTNIKRHYDTFNASFVEHISITRKTMKFKKDVKWTIKGFQNRVYITAMAFEICKILCLRDGDFGITFTAFSKAIIANRGRYGISKCSLMAASALLAYMLPLAVRRNICVFLLSRFKPNSSFLTSLSAV